MNSRGYVEGRIWVNGKQVQKKKHRHVMEQHLGRALEPHEDVHHKDGDKQNNSVENLEVLTHGEHTRLTQAERTNRPRGYKMNLSPEQRAARSARTKAMHARRAALRLAQGDGGRDE